MNEDDLSNRDKFILAALEDIDPDTLKFLLNLQEHELLAQPIGEVLIEAINLLLESKSYEEREKIIKLFRESGIDLENL
jgi:hypothetical protein